MTDLLAKQVARALQEDGMVEIFFAMTEEERIYCCEAYASSEIKKFSTFVANYLTNDQFRNKFRECVVDLIKLKVAA